MTMFSEGEALAAGIRRLLLVGPLPPPGGGMANQTAALQRGLTSRGVDVMMVRQNRPYRPAWVARLPWLRALLRLLPYVREVWQGLSRVNAVHLMANSGVSWFVFAVPVLVLARLKAVPVVVSYRGGRAGPFLDRLGWLVRPTLRMAARVVVPSPFLEGVFARQGIRAHVLPNGIDLAQFPLPACRRAPAAPHIVVTRNLEAIYGIDCALRVFARVLQAMPDARMTVIGDGPERQGLESLAATLGVSDRVRFLGNVSQEQVGELYRGAALMLNTSRADNMPNAILEAQASGVPVVSSNAGGIPHIVADGRSGLLADVDDVDALARACHRVLSEPALAERLSTEGRRAVERQDWPVVLEDWLRHYAEVADGVRQSVRT